MLSQQNRGRLQAPRRPMGGGRTPARPMAIGRDPIAPQANPFDQPSASAPPQGSTSALPAGNASAPPQGSTSALPAGNSGALAYHGTVTPGGITGRPAGGIPTEPTGGAQSFDDGGSVDDGDGDENKQTYNDQPAPGYNTQQDALTQNNPVPYMTGAQYDKQDPMKLNPGGIPAGNPDISQGHPETSADISNPSQRMPNEGPGVGQTTDPITGGIQSMLNNVADLFKYGYSKFGLGGAGDTQDQSQQQTGDNADGSVSLDDGGPVPMTGGIPTPEDQHIADMVQMNWSAAQRAVQNAKKKSSGTQSFADGGSVDDETLTDEGVGATQADGDNPTTGAIPESTDQNEPTIGSSLADAAQSVGSKAKDIVGGISDFTHKVGKAIHDYGQGEDLPKTYEGEAQTDEGVGATQEDKQNPRLVGLVSGSGAMAPEQVDALKKRIDPDGRMSPDEQNLAALAYASQNGGKEMGLSVLQALRSKFGAYQQDAIVSVEGTKDKIADLTRSLSSANAAFPNLPDGQQVQFVRGKDGQTVVAQLTGPDGRMVPTALTIPQYYDFMKNAQFDAVFHKGVDKLLDEATSGSGEQPQVGGQQPEPSDEEKRQTGLKATRQTLKDRYDTYESVANRMFPMVDDQDKRTAYIQSRMNAEQESEADIKKAAAGQEGKMEVARANNETKLSLGKDRNAAINARTNAMAQWHMEQNANALKTGLQKLQQQAMQEQNREAAQVIGKAIQSNALDPKGLTDTLQQVGIDPQAFFSSLGGKKAPPNLSPMEQVSQPVSAPSEYTGSQPPGAASPGMKWQTNSKGQWRQVPAQ